MPAGEPLHRSFTPAQVLAVATPPVDVPIRRDVAPSSPPAAPLSTVSSKSSAPPASPPRPFAVSPGRIAVRDEPSTFRRLIPALALIAASLVITLLGSVYSAVAGEVLAFGPIKLAWIAGLCLIGGVVLGARAFLPRD